MAGKRQAANVPKKTPERNLENWRRYYAANRDRIQSQNRIWKNAHPNREREIRLRKKYGIELSEFENLNRTQNGLCKICGLTNRNGRLLVVDHDHAAEEMIIRGLLCDNCNKILGMFKDDPKRFLRAADYLYGSL